MIPQAIPGVDIWRKNLNIEEERKKTHQKHQKQRNPSAANPNEVQTNTQEIERLHHDSPSEVLYLNMVQTATQEPPSKLPVFFTSTTLAPLLFLKHLIFDI